MHGVVSLLDEAHWQAVGNLWDELEQVCGIKRMRELVPYPHVSYVIAEEYDFDRLDAALARLAADTPPFIIRTSGLGIFTGAQPVLYIAVVRDRWLTRHHQMVWAALAEANLAVGISDLYHPDRWVPHITLAQHDLDAATLPEVVRMLGGRMLSWEVPVREIAVLRHHEGEQCELWQRYELRG